MSGSTNLINLLNLLYVTPLWLVENLVCFVHMLTWSLAPCLSCQGRGFWRFLLESFSHLQGSKLSCSPQTQLELQTTRGTHKHQLFNRTMLFCWCCFCCTWPVFARAFQFSKFQNQCINADVFHILLELLVNLQFRRTVC